MYKQLNKRLMTLMLITGILMAAMMNMGQAQAVDGPTSLTETYKSWIVRCATPSAGKDQPSPTRICEMAQELRQQKSGQLLLAMALQPDIHGASLTFIAPFGLLLSEGIKVAVDGNTVAQGGFRTCLPRGCVSTINLAQEVLDRFSAGAEATITMRGVKGRKITLTLSLSGFTAAWNRLEKI